MRIISLVPSLTELLNYLGLQEEVVGITKFCVHPTEWFRTKKRVGGTKKINFEAIANLQPTLIIANKEENTKEDVEYLQQHYNVFLSNITSLQDAYRDIASIGRLTHQVDKANQLINILQADFTSLQEKKFTALKCLYLIWQNPYMAAGNGTFINTILQLAAFNNCLATSRYPALSLQEIIQLNPEVLLLSSEPYPFGEKHIKDLLIHLPACKIHLVDGEIFSWYGSRLQHTTKYLMALREKLDKQLL